MTRTRVRRFLAYPPWMDREPGSGGAPAPTFPATLLRVRVELYLGGVWVDISPYVQYSHRIIIDRGLRSSQRRTTAATCTMVLKNQDSRFSKRNVSGPYFGLLKQNTPLRVWANPGSGDSLRFTGRVPSFPPRLGGHPNDRFVQVVAFGRRAAFEQGQEPIESAQYRYLSNRSQSQSLTLSYRSFEDDLPGYVAGPPGSGPLPDLSRGGAFSGTSANVARAAVIGGTPTSWRAEIDVMFPLDRGDASSAPALQWASDGTLSFWRLGADETQANLIYVTQATGGLTTLNSGVDVYDGLWHHWQIDAEQNGGNIDITVRMDNATVITSSPAGTLGDVNDWFLHDDIPAAGAERMPAVGHVHIQGPIPDESDSYSAFQGWAGERPAERWARLLTEEGIPYTVRELVTDFQRMGAQGRKEVSALLEECEAACEGMIDEDFSDNLRLTSRSWWMNQARTLTLDYTASPSQIKPPLVPTDGTDGVHNDWSITRAGGITARAKKEFGPLNIQDPEDDAQGVGPLREQATLALHTDQQPLQYASHRVARDTIDEPRFPDVEINLAGAPSLISAWLACDIGSRTAIDNPPVDAGPENVDSLLFGYTEDFTQANWRIGAYLVPNGFYRQALYDAPEPRYDCSASTLAAALVADTSMADDLESGVGSWVAVNATFPSSSVRAHSGSLAGLLTVTGSPAQAYVRREWPVTAGQKYRIIVWLNSPAGWTDVHASIDWFASPGGVGYISTSAPAGTTLAASTWESRTATGTAPATATYAQMGPTLGGTPTGITAYVDDLQFGNQLDIAVADTCAWAHDDGDYEIIIDGETMTVVAIDAVAGTYPARTQVLSVMRAAAPATHAIGAGVHVKHTARYAL